MKLNVGVLCAAVIALAFVLHAHACAGADDGTVPRKKIDRCGNPVVFQYHHAESNNFLVTDERARDRHAPASRRLKAARVHA